MKILGSVKCAVLKVDDESGITKESVGDSFLGDFHLRYLRGRMVSFLATE